jgi:hypothetical protein
LQQRIAISQKIINDSHHQQYNLEGRGSWSVFSSYTMNYDYLTWWLGDPPSTKKEKLLFTIQEVGGYAILHEQKRK